MRRFRLVVLTLVIVMVSTMSVAHAYPPCGPTDNPQPTAIPGGICTPRWLTGGWIRIRDDLPFVMLRRKPALDSPTTAKVIRTPYMNLMIQPIKPSHYLWDGTQWWWYVRVFRGSKSVRGWVEQSALTDQGYGGAELQIPNFVPVDEAAYKLQAKWSYFHRVRIKRTSPFAWVRRIPGSSDILVQVSRRDVMYLLPYNPYFDGTQWWWAVQYISGDTILNGWLEQGSMQQF